MLRRWLESPHVREWWGDADTELGYINDMLEGRDTTRPFIFHVDGEPAGYIQYWFIADAIRDGYDDEAPWLHDLPDHAIGIDLFIGTTGNVSRGIGTAAIRAFIAELFAEGHRLIIIDPDEANHRAVRAYEKAGFVPYDRYRDESGVTLLMKFAPQRFRETEA